MDNRFGGHHGSRDTNDNFIPEASTRTGSGRRGDPIEILQFSQDNSYNFEDEEGLSVIPPSPERPHGSTLTVKSPLTRDVDVVDNNIYSPYSETPDRTTKSPNWHMSKRTPPFPWEIQRRITFSQESGSQQSIGTPVETQECISSYTQRQMSPEKAHKRPHYSSSEEADLKKRKTSQSKMSSSAEVCTIRSPYSMSQNNLKESPRGKDSVASHQTSPSFFKFRVKSPQPVPSDLQYSDKNTSSPHKTPKQPTWESAQSHSGTENWHLKLSESQDSQSTSEGNPSTYQQHSAGFNAAADTQPDYTTTEKDLPLDKEISSPGKRGYSSSSHSVAYHLLGSRKHSTGRTSTPCDFPDSLDNATPRTVPPLVLQLSRQSTITPNSSAMTTTPSPRHLSQFSEEHISPPPSQTDQVLVDSTETSAIFHQISNNSIDTSQLDLSLGLEEAKSPSFDRHPSTDQLPPRPPSSVEQSCSSSRPVVASNHNQANMHLEGTTGQQLKSTTTDSVPETNTAVPQKGSGKFLFSPELNVENGEIGRQKKRPHSDEEFVRNVRRTRDCSVQTEFSNEDSHLVDEFVKSVRQNQDISVQTDISSEVHSQSSQTQTKFLFKGGGHMTLHSGSNLSQTEPVTEICYRDVCYRYRDHKVDGLIVKCERITSEERTFENCKLEDLPALFGLPQDSSNHWSSSLSSGEMADVSSSVPSSKSGSNSSLPSFNIPNSMSQVSRVLTSNKEKIKNRRSISLNTLVEKQSQATPSSSTSTTSSSSPAIHGTEQDDKLFAKPLEPSQTHQLPSKETPQTPPTVSTNQVPETVWITPTKRSGGRSSHKKGAKRFFTVKRRTPKSASPKKSLPTISSISSPEVTPPPPAITDIPPDESESPLSPGNFRTGMQVMARWKDSYFYSGTLAEMDTTGKWEVNFEDGSQRCVKESDILDETLVVKGQSVLALSKDGYYDPGVVNSLYFEDKEQGFVVDLDSGLSYRCKRGTVILSSDQAASLLRRRYVEHPVAAVSMDNIVEGKRRRTPKAFADNGSPTGPAARPMATRALGVLPQQPPFQPTRRRYRPDPNLQSSDYNSTNEEPKECPSLIPRLKLQRSKKDPDQYWCSDAEPEELPEKSKQSPSSVDTTSAPNIRSPKKGSPKKSPKKPSPSKSSPKIGPSKSSSSIQDNNVDDEERELGPFSENNEIFEGLYFLISCADRSSSQNKTVTDSMSSCDSADEIPAEHIPHLDRDHVSLQLQRAGGVVLESFEETLTVPKKQIVLISNTYLRTLKYIKCLAAGIPCISVEWVNNCCQMSKRLPLKIYMLPAGYNIVEKTVVNWDNRSRDALANLRVMLWSEKNPDFLSFWTPVLLAAQASAVAQPQDTTRLTGSFSHVNVVVADPSMSTNIYRRFHDNLNIPVISSEWLIQCIITGSRLPVDAHPKFKHTYVNG